MFFQRILAIWILKNYKCLFFALKQRLAYAITPETEHHLVDNGEVRQFTVSVGFIIMIYFENDPLITAYCCC